MICQKKGSHPQEHIINQVFKLKVAREAALSKTEMSLKKTSWRAHATWDQRGELQSKISGLASYVKLKVGVLYFSKEFLFLLG